MTRVIRLSLTLEEPTAITDGSADMSGHRTLSWIPGTSLLGACVPAFGIAPEDDRFARLFLEDGVRFIDAVPAAEGLRSRPRPLSLAWPATEAAAGSAPPIDRATESLPDGRFDRARVGFVGVDPRTSIESARVVRDHVGIDPETRTAATSILFAYEALPAGSRFVGYVLTEHDDLADLVIERINEAGRLRIGRSRAGGYGRVRVLAESADRLPEWESDTTARPSRLVLATDYCPPTGMSPMAALRAELSKHDATITESWCETRIVRGFRGVWGLPRPPIEVLCRGSVFTLETTRDLPEDIRLHGLGRRRNEGFGRVSFDVAVAPKVGEASPATVADIDRGSSDPAGVAASLSLLSLRATRRIAADIAQAACHSRRADALVETLARSNRLRSSQLSNLRSAIGDHRVVERPGLVKAWFEGVLEKSRGDAWRKTIVTALDGTAREATMADVILAFIDDATPPWSNAAAVVCGLADRDTDLPRFTDAETRHRLASMFIDGIVHRVARERRREEEAA